MRNLNTELNDFQNNTNDESYTDLIDTIKLLNALGFTIEEIAEEIPLILYDELLRKDYCPHATRIELIADYQKKNPKLDYNKAYELMILAATLINVNGIKLEDIEISYLDMNKI